MKIPRVCNDVFHCAVVGQSTHISGDIVIDKWMWQCIQMGDRPLNTVRHLEVSEGGFYEKDLLMKGRKCVNSPRD